ncbi:MAG TPA: hypothetical protein VIM56_07385 [Rhizomicrobium sp.]
MHPIPHSKIRIAFLASLCLLPASTLAKPASKPTQDAHALSHPALSQSEIEEQRVVGRWLDPIMGIYLIKKYTTGYVLIIEYGNAKPAWIKLRQHPSKRGLRLDAVDSDAGDRFIILPNGKLLTGDREGDVTTLEPARAGSTEARTEELNQLRADIACRTDVIASPSTTSSPIQPPAKTPSKAVPAGITNGPGAP